MKWVRARKLLKGTSVHILRFNHMVIQMQSLQQVTSCVHLISCAFSSSSGVLVAVVPRLPHPVVAEEPEMAA